METNTNTETKPKNIWAEIAERAMRTGANVPVVEVEFDREKALHGLVFNYDRNRRPKPKVIANFRHIIDDFNFAAGSMLRIAKNDDGDWVLIDGQHRLTAIAESGARLWLLVVVDMRPAKIAYANIDNVGTLRTGSDAVSSILGWSTGNWMSVVGAARLIEAEFARAVFLPASRSKPASAEKIAEVLEKYRAATEKVISIAAFGKSLQSRRAAQLSVLIVAAHYQPERFYSWFERAAADDMLPKDSTEKRLSETFTWQSSTRYDRLRLNLATVTIWNAHYREEQMPSLPRITVFGERLTRWPGILGAPFGPEK